jgi:DNA polymerase lambda
MASTPCRKTEIIDALDTLRRRDVAAGERFKAIAYAKVITQLKALDRICTYEDVATVKGIGKAISEKIKEVLATGALASAEVAKKTHHIDVYDALLACYGIGPAKARELVATGIRSIDDLREAVRKTPSLLNDNQKIGLKYYDDLLLRIPREEMVQHDELLYENLPPRGKGKIKAKVVGSFRRQAATSGDIDILVRGEDPRLLRQFVSRLTETGYIREILALGDKKCMAICALGDKGVARRLDILLTPREEYAFAILYFTGSDRFNVAMRQYALTRGYSLNEHALTRISTNVEEAPPMKREKDIFAFLGLEYVEPSARAGPANIVPIVAGSAPSAPKSKVPAGGAGAAAEESDE